MPFVYDPLTRLSLKLSNIVINHVLLIEFHRLTLAVAARILIAYEICVNVWCA